MMYRALSFLAAAAAAQLGLAAPAPAQDGADLLAQACGGCHAADAEGRLSRIKDQRKTPEGWLMTIVRMRLVHDVEIDPATQARLVDFLSETQGLAPAETEGYRYILEREPAVIEQSDQTMMEMCGRCHSVARAMLQRRTAEEWSLHMDFHVGQYPTTEYQALGRDREWFRIAKEEIAPRLAKELPLQSPAWDAWRAQPKPDPAGAWVFATRLPEHGPVYGRFTVESGDRGLSLAGEVVIGEGRTIPITGSVRIYTGYEWRASLAVDGVKYRQVLALSPDGNSLDGRLFRAEDDGLGGRLHAAKVGGPPQVVAVLPPNLKTRTEADVQVVGTGLDELGFEGPVSARSTQANPYGAEATLISTATPGAVTLAAGSASGKLIVYEKLDGLKVEPAYAIARVGGPEGSTAPVRAMFRAVGYLAGADGKPGTDDDIAVGEVPARWQVQPFDETAAQLEDAKYAGKMDAAHGIFTPAEAGPNPERPFSTNNAGNLKVVATGEGVSGEAQLIVTVQRWNDPPIR